MSISSEPRPSASRTQNCTFGHAGHLGHLAQIGQGSGQLEQDNMNLHGPQSAALPCLGIKVVKLALTAPASGASLSHGWMGQRAVKGSSFFHFCSAKLIYSSDWPHPVPAGH